jgi:hypothetical protein
MASGMSTSDRANSGDSSNAIGASKIPMVDSHDTGDCDPCLRTSLLPISPTDHLDYGMDCRCWRSHSVKTSRLDLPAATFRIMSSCSSTVASIW